ncbi:MAG: lysophospholipid acyltransferase family protein [Verrucomicrobiota bacterium]
MINPSSWLRRFDVRGIVWRQGLDWALANFPFYFLPFSIWFCTLFFFFFAALARRALVANFSVLLPKSSLLANNLRAWRTMYNYAWTITEGTHYKLTKAHFSYEIQGAAALERLGAAKGAICLTAHLGNYDLGAALFAEKFHREIRMVRAPEADQQTAQHLNQSLQQTAAGGVRVDYNTAGNLLSFDLLHALRQGEIVSIQGDRVIAGLARSSATFFGREVSFPAGPFILARVARCEIFPLFIVRTGYRKYKIIVCEPIRYENSGAPRDEDVALATAKWSVFLEGVIARYWDQWYAFVPMFEK